MTPRCCGAPLPIEAWLNSRFQDRTWASSIDPLYRCPRCLREGYREDFDPDAAALDRRLAIPYNGRRRSRYNPARE